MRAAVSACAVWLGLCCAAGPLRAQVSFATRGPEDVEVKRQLALWLEVAVQEQPQPPERAPAQIVADAMQRAAPGYVVVLDRSSANVHVLRPSDRTAVARALPAEVMRDSPSAVALTAAEMLEWLGAIPTAHERGSQAPPQKQDAVPAAARAPWAISFGSDVELRDSPGHELSVVRPALQVALQLQPRAWRASWLGMGARVSPFGARDRAVATAGLGFGPSRVRYSSTDAALSLQLGHDSAGATLLAELGAGLSMSDLELRSSQRGVLGSDQRVAAYVALGAALRYRLLWGFAFAVGAEGQYLPLPTRYRVDGVDALDEGRLRLAARMGMIWQSAR